MQGEPRRTNSMFRSVTVAIKEEIEGLSKDPEDARRWGEAIYRLLTSLKAGVCPQLLSM